MSKKKKHFIKRLAQNQERIWDAEFERDKYRRIREELRRNYDKLKERVAVMESQKEATKDKKAKAALDTQIKNYNDDLTQMEKQLAGLQDRVENEQNPESLVNKIAAHVTLGALIKEYLNKL